MAMCFLLARRSKHLIRRRTLLMLSGPHNHAAASGVAAAAAVVNVDDDDQYYQPPAAGRRCCIQQHALSNPFLGGWLPVGPATSASSSTSSFGGGGGLRFESTQAVGVQYANNVSNVSGEDEEEEEEDGELRYGSANNQAAGMDLPGGRVTFTSEMSFIGDNANKRVHCFRLLDDNGHLLESNMVPQQQQETISEELGVKIYKHMVTLQTMDNILYEAQRQGRISFYLTSYGEEAINISSAAALSPQDVVFAQYREPGVLLWRGFSLQEFANQCFGNKADYGKGRQMPIHYGSSKHNYFTISSPIATQIPQSVGAAYSLKTAENKEDACVVTYMGDGCTSEGDFHAGLNFAAVLEVPIVFICRNNGWAISTPSTEQFRSDGVVVRGRAYGIRSIRVDGNDALAVYNVVKTAREMAVREQKPVLVEAMTYRVSHHSTSDDSTKYRPAAEIEQWKLDRNPLTRFRNWIERNGWWNEDEESQLQKDVRKEMIRAIQVAEKMEKPEISELFTDVYDKPTSDLLEQERNLRETIARYHRDYPSDVSL